MTSEQFTQLDVEFLGFRDGSPYLTPLASYVLAQKIPRGRDACLFELNGFTLGLEL
jgi:hypothetical protein